MTKKKESYIGNIKEAVSTTLTGAKLTFTHLKDSLIRKKNPAINANEENYFKQMDKGIVTLNYPSEAIPVPDHGRYQLHNEIDDCIVCDKCAKICPVNCIDIVVIWPFLLCNVWGLSHHKNKQFL